MQNHSSERKVALVTGSSSGVGAATCQQLAERGWNVVINYTRSEREAHEVESSCSSLGAETLVSKADVSEDSDCRRIVNETIERWGRLDALVNNAGMTRFCDYSDLEGLTKQDFLDIYAVNVVGTYQMTRAATPHLRQSDDGVIVNTSSVASLTGQGSSMAYAASKGAMTTLTLSLAHSLAPEIRVNAVCPGFIQGRWTKNFLGESYEEVRASVENASALKRSALPEDVARSIVHLVCEARLVTG
ncbi:MAG: SDR family NAD(P)-dependent oxidoreductase, partial [Acidobacteriota bacterium]